MLKPLISLIFGCRHDNLTWPQSPRRVGPLHRFSRKEPAHVTCTDCGAEFDYCIKTMTVGKRIYPIHHQHPDLGPALGRTEA